MSNDFQKNKNKIVIIFVVFLSFVFFVFGGLYYFKDFKDEVPEEKNILQTTQEEILIFQQKIDDYQQKVNNEKKINQENIRKNIETLKNLGIWDWFKKDYKEYLDAVESSQKTTKLKLNELLEKVKKKEKDLASFREELEKLRQERKKNIDEKADILVKISEKMKEEVEKPMPFFATWTAVILLSIICTIICIICFRKILYEKGEALSFFGASCGLSFASEIIIILFCILLKPNRFREAHKRHFSCPKALFLLLIPVIIPLLFVLIALKC